MGLNYYGMFVLKHNVHFDIKYRYRNYSSVFNDTTFNNDYGEIYSNFSSTVRFSNRISWKLESIIEYRKYGLMNSVTTDYMDFEVKPAIVFNVKELWTIELGYVHSFRNYKEIESQIIYEEDYYSDGLSIAIEIFQIDKFMFSITDIYSMKRYPHSATKDISNFTLYTDRNTNSLLCYFSWTITKNWELGLIANYDADRDPRQENSDTRSTMLSLDLTFMF